MSGICQPRSILALWLLLYVCSTVSALSVTTPACWRRPVHRIGCYSQRHRLPPSSIGIYLEALHGDVERSIKSEDVSLRNRLRRLTGFSLTALRATMRMATGVSLTVLYAGTIAVSGAWIRQTTKIILSILPSWARYFAQPFLVAYYVPWFVLRCMTAPNRNQGKQNHDAMLESWKQAVDTADHSSSYWPLHLNKMGEIEADSAEIDFNDVIAESVEVTMENMIKKGIP